MEVTTPTDLGVGEKEIDWHSDVVGREISSVRDLGWVGRGGNVESSSEVGEWCVGHVVESETSIMVDFPSDPQFGVSIGANSDGITKTTSDEAPSSVELQAVRLVLVAQGRLSQWNQLLSKSEESSNIGFGFIL